MIYSLRTRKKEKHTPIKSPNGFAELFALVCMGLVLETVALMSGAMISNAQLALAQRQSTMDLSCISIAKGMIAHNEWVTRCSLDSSLKKTKGSETIQGKDVIFIDCDSYVLCQYENKGKMIEMKVYYSDGLISGMDIDAI